MQERKIALKIYSEALLLILLLALITVGALYLFKPDSLAWFSKNEQVTSSGTTIDTDAVAVTMQVYAKGPRDDDFVAIASLDHIFSDLMPGERVTFRVEIANNENTPLTVGVAFEAFDGCETPLVLDGRYYYLSTQLRIVQTDEYLLAPPTDFLSYESEMTLENKTASSVTVPAKSTTETTFELEFVNYANIDQNAYQGFGESAFCTRKLILVL